MIQAREICLYFGNQKVFDNISFTINETQKIGLVGKNGSGKSTLLKAIAKYQTLDSGEIAILSKAKVAYMPQDVVLLSEKTILDEAFSSFEHASKVQDEVLKIEASLENTQNHTADLIEKYSALKKELGELNIESLYSQAKKILQGLGFTLQQLQMKTDSLSVGWKMRLALAKLLLQRADFYLFDEPTNHLDITSKDWFLNFLRKSNFGFILVSHDRYFLDEACTSILELSAGKAKQYSGNYTKYIVEKEHNQKLQETAFREQQKEIAQKMATIERFRYKASKAKMAQSMLKAVEKIELITIENPLPKIKLKFPHVAQSGRIVLTAENLSFSFDDKKIFENISLSIERGEKVALIAPNGSGKSTLFNLISNKLPLQSGKITFGLNVTMAVFSQDQNKSLDPQKTILEEIENSSPQVPLQQVRSFLGAFLFGEEEIKKKIKVLSGGEKNRVSMVEILLRKANLLLLDEPTNHLDLESKEILLDALKEYNGTILFVSHDRDFINKLATRVLELSKNECASYMGSYENYIYQKEHSTNQETNVKNEKPKIQNNQIEESKKISNSKEFFELSKKSKKLESSIEKLEKEIEETQNQLLQKTIANEINELTTKLADLEKSRIAQFEEWLEIQENITK